MCLVQDGATSHIAHMTLSLFASSFLDHPNRLTLIQLSIIGMSMVECLGDGDLPMKDDLHIQQSLMDGWNGITQRMLNDWDTCM